MTRVFLLSLSVLGFALSRKTTSCAWPHRRSRNRWPKLWRRSKPRKSCSKRAVNPKRFFAELKRRHVYKVAVAYAVAGWLVMQVAATVVPALHLPDAITSAVVLLVFLGFPIALV